MIKDPCDIHNTESDIPSYKQRLIDEYSELKDRYNKLHKMLIKHEAGTLGFKFNCPLPLLEEQVKYMGYYLRILEIRAEMEGVELPC